MGHVVDRWTVPGPKGRRVKGPRHGRGKRWLARWAEPDGRERSKACSSKDEALALLAKVDTDKRAGTYVAPSSTTFREYAEAWRRRQAHHSQATAEQVRSRLQNHAYPAFGDMPLAKVTRGMVQDLVAGSGLAPSTVRVLYTYVSAVFESAVEDRLIPITPCRRITMPRADDVAVTPLTVEEVAQIADAVPAPLRAMVWLGAGSGLRPGELRALTVDRVKGGVLVVDRQLAAGSTREGLAWGPLKRPGSRRRVPLAASTAQLLEEHLEKHPPGPLGLVFTARSGGPLGRSHLQYAWREAAGRPKGEGWHELRHHHASLLIAAGLSPRAVADRLGHADPSETLKTYAHLWPTDQASILSAIEAAHGGVSWSVSGPSAVA